MNYDTKLLTDKEIDVAAKLLRQGECVAFPTETVYGLGANALSSEAVKKIYVAKGRPSDNPLIIHCHDINQLRELVQDWSGDVQRIMDRFWPGPLTLVLPKRDSVPDIVTGGLDTVAVRIPDHPIALELIKAAGLPIAAPSANVSGKPSPTRANHVWYDLAGRIPAIIDGGPTGWGVESTVLDCTSKPFRVLRPGGITLEQLMSLVAVELDPDLNLEVVQNPKSPGMKYKHYSPEAKVVLFIGNDIEKAILQQLQCLSRDGKRVVVMAFSENKDCYNKWPVLEMGSKESLQQASANIYHLLRKADHLGFDTVLVEGLEHQDLGLTIMNRLRKAAGTNIIQT